MAGISNFLARSLLRHVWRGTVYTPPTTRYAALYPGDPGADGTSSTEITGNAYARIAVTWKDVAGSGTPGPTLNNAATFPQATPAGWGLIAYVGFWDALTGGNFLGSIQLATARTSGALDTFVLPDSNLDISMTS